MEDRRDWLSGPGGSSGLSWESWTSGHGEVAHESAWTHQATNRPNLRREACQDCARGARRARVLRTEQSWRHRSRPAWSSIPIPHLSIPRHARRAALSSVLAACYPQPTGRRSSRRYTCTDDTERARRGERRSAVRFHNLPWSGERSPDDPGALGPSGAAFPVGRNPAAPARCKKIERPSATTMRAEHDNLKR